MDFEQYKAVITEAIAGEVEAQKFYTGVANGIKKPMLKELFFQLAEEEKKHETILTDILSKGKITIGNFNFESDFKVAETIDMPEVTPQMDLKDAIGIAMKNEEAAMKKYMALADNCKDAQLKTLFQELASMERDHKFKMEQSFVDVAYPEVW